MEDFLFFCDNLAGSATNRIAGAYTNTGRDQAPCSYQQPWKRVRTHSRLQVLCIYQILHNMQRVKLLTILYVAYKRYNRDKI